MKTTKTEARKTLAIDGDLLDAVLKGGLILDYQFNGWEWSVLVKLSQPTNDGFLYAQFETIQNGSDFHLMVQRNGSTKKQVWKAYNDDFTETRRMKQIAFELGNIQ